jgi:hypothetical protein
MTFRGREFPETACSDSHTSFADVNEFLSPLSPIFVLFGKKNGKEDSRKKLFFICEFHDNCSVKTIFYSGA